MGIQFYQTSSGKSPVEDFLSGLSHETQTEFVEALNLLEQGRALTMPLSRNLSSIYKGLHELRFRDQAGQIRFFYFIKKGASIYLLHALRKKTQTISKKDRELILKRIKEI